MVGNGVSDDKFDGNALVPFAHGMGLISDDLFEVEGTLRFYMNFYANFTNLTYAQKKKKKKCNELH